MTHDLSEVAKKGNPWAEVKNDWETPPELFEKLNAEFHFDVDIAASAENSKCDIFIPYPQTDALLENWNSFGARGFMNPPYSNWRPWAAKAYRAALAPNNPITIVGLLPVDTSTQAFHEFIYNKTNVEIRFLKRRLRFYYKGKPGPSPARFASMVVIWRPLGTGLRCPTSAFPAAQTAAPPWVIKR